MAAQNEACGFALVESGNVALCDAMTVAEARAGI